MNRSVEQSFKSRMRTISVERRIATPELWDILVLERFLVRVAASRYADKFILKGGMLLSRYVNIGRHTQDLDFMLRNASSDLDLLSKAFDDILAMSLEDEFEFFDLTIRPLSHPHMKYPGARVSMRASFGKSRFKVIVDVGCGDFVEPVKQALPLLGTNKAPLFESYVEVNCYPKEFIFAEKLEAVIYLGSRNSRMKDYHDLYHLMQLQACTGPNLDRVVRAVFQHRGTSIKLPIAFEAQDYLGLQMLWGSHVETVASKGSLPDDFRNLVEYMNSWLQQETSLFGTS